MKKKKTAFSSLPEGDAVFVPPPIGMGNSDVGTAIAFQNINCQIAQEGKIAVTFDDKRSFAGNGSAVAEASSSGTTSVVTGPY